MTRLTEASLSAISKNVRTPDYSRETSGVGIVHLGLGAFHKAHQAFYTDAAMALGGGNWSIIGVSMRNEQIAADFNDQDGLFTLLERGTDGASAQIIGSIARALCAATQPDDVMTALCDPDVRIVTTTVTEKGYGIDRASGGVDTTNVVIAHDLDRKNSPIGTIGLIVTALEKRRANGIPPFTALCCDNLPDNGAFLHAGLVDFANQFDENLSNWITDNVACPASMVDRITPAQTSSTRTLAQDLTGAEDILAIETENFYQWVIEDNFPTGRPAWDRAGAIFTDNVAPFEKMKLRLLNGSHSLIAYMGLLTGKKYVRDVMADPGLETIVRRHLEAATATLPSMPDIDLPSYCADLIKRFHNPNIAHETFQIAADGSEKMPQRIFAPAVDAINSNQSVRAFAFATALWVWFCRGSAQQATDHELIDPRAELLRSAAQSDTPDQILSKFEKIPALLPKALVASTAWRREVLGALKELSVKTPHQVIEAECGNDG
jgi:fructuronate reductase